MSSSVAEQSSARDCCLPSLSFELLVSGGVYTICFKLESVVAVSVIACDNISHCPVKFVQLPVEEEELEAFLPLPLQLSLVLVVTVKLSAFIPELSTFSGLELVETEALSGILLLELG